MKRFALIGHPVAGSLSPRLFSAAYDGRFAYDLVDRESFAEAWQVFLDSYDGINVTAPFKMDAFSKVKALSESALETGAVNLVVRRQADSRICFGANEILTTPPESETPSAVRPCDGTPETLVGYNTDVDGVVESVRECGLPVSDALVVGTGGAARAAVVAARRLGCRVTVTGRSLEKAAMLAAGIHSFPPIIGRSLVPSAALAAGAAPVNVMFLDQIDTLSPDLIIYTLPGSAPVPPGLPTAGALVLEAEYKSPALASARCRAYISGRRWLLHQAVAGYRLFTGLEPSIAAMSAAL